MSSKTRAERAELEFLDLWTQLYELKSRLALGGLTPQRIEEHPDVTQARLALWDAYQDLDNPTRGTERVVELMRQFHGSQELKEGKA